MLIWGRIKFWPAERSYCFVRQDRPRTPDCFLHVDVIRDSGLSPIDLPEGRAVRLEAEEDAAGRGLRAIFVELI